MRGAAQVLRRSRGLRTERGWSTRFEYRGLLGSDGRDHGVNVTVEKGF